MKTKLLPEEKITNETYNKFADIWISSHNTDNFYSTEIDYFHKLLPQGAILEIGFGSGRDAKELMLGGYEYTGIDISSQFVKIAKKNFPDVEFYEQSIYDINFTNKDKFDGFWAVAVLLHIPKSRINEALQQIKKNCRKKAIGFISLKDGIGEFMRKSKIGENEIERFFSYYSKDEFIDILKLNSYKLLSYKFKKDGNFHCFFCRNLKSLK